MDIDDDVLSLARSLADAHQSTAGKVISDLVRKGLRSQTRPAKNRKRNGFILMPVRKNGKPVTMEMVNRLRDEME